MTPTRTFSATGESVHAALLAALAADRSLADIARAAGIHYTALSRFKGREREIGTAGLESLAQALGMEVSVENVAKATGTPVCDAFEMMPEMEAISKNQLHQVETYPGERGRGFCESTSYLLRIYVENLDGDVFSIQMDPQSVDDDPDVLAEVGRIWISFHNHAEWEAFKAYVDNSIKKS